MGNTNGLELGEVATLFVYDDTPFVLCDKLFKAYDPHFNAYYVRRTSDYILLRLSDLYDYHPLGMYKFQKKSFVNLRHFVLW